MRDPEFLKVCRKLLCCTVVAAIVFTACKSKNIYHMPPKQMEQVLLDITIAEAYCSQVKDSLHKAGTKNYDSLAVYYSYILEHHKITADQLTQSLNWYKEHPADLDSVCTNILPVVIRWQTKNNTR